MCAVSSLTHPLASLLTLRLSLSLARARSTADTPGPISQGRFLTALGLQPRLAALLRSAPTEERRKEIESAARRLVDKTGMGEQYKIMGVVPKGKGQGVGEEAGVFPFNLQ